MKSGTKKKSSASDLTDGQFGTTDTIKIVLTTPIFWGLLALIVLVVIGVISSLSN